MSLEDIEAIRPGLALVDPTDETKEPLEVALPPDMPSH
jgi:hypothetical protein